MTALAGEEWTAVVCALADAFAVRAHEQEVLRDRARPGTMVHHHAHSATLWRSAEGSLRARIGELGLGP